jgi:hypothetical protein
LNTIEREGINGAVESTLICGTIGEAAGAEFLGFTKIYRNLPDPDSVIANPDQADLASDPAENWALCGALAHRATPDNIASILRYGERMASHDSIGPEFMTVLARGAAIRDDNVMATRAFREWAARNQDVLI